MAVLTLVTVLFCAALPTGLPLSVHHGSAFDPATTSVVLLAKDPLERATAKPQAQPDPGTAPHPFTWIDHALPLVLAALIVPCALARRNVPARSETASRQAGYPSDAHRPRGPPRAPFPLETRLKS